MTAPRPGSLPWMRMWHGAHLTRGAAVRVNGQRARVLSTRDGKVAVRYWSTGQRTVVAPHQIAAA